MPIEKMPTWDEWSNLSEEQRDYSLYKVLVALTSHDCHTDVACQERAKECGALFENVSKHCETMFESLDERITSVSQRKLMDRVVSAIIGAAVGVATAIGVWFNS